MISTGRKIVYFLFYGSLCLASENRPVTTNREILYALSDSVMSKIYEHGIKQYPSISLKIGNDTITDFYRNYFINGLSLRHINVYEQTNSSETTLELFVQESSVFFGELFTESFLGRKRTERTVHFKVIANLSSVVDGKIFWSKQFSETRIDTLDFTDIEQMNNYSLPLTSYKKPVVSFFDTVIEPAIVIFSTGVAVYLFFTIRS
jgi:hypothetical protein